MQILLTKTVCAVNSGYFVSLYVETHLLHRSAAREGCAGR